MLSLKELQKETEEFTLKLHEYEALDLIKKIHKALLTETMFYDLNKGTPYYRTKEVVEFYTYKINSLENCYVKNTIQKLLLMEIGKLYFSSEFIETNIWYNDYYIKER